MSTTLRSARTATDRRAVLESESGSAYIIALLALVVLSIIGLSLTLMTQSELLMGANEITTTKIFYEAQAGIGDATGRALLNDFSPKTMTLPYPGIAGLIGYESRVQTSPFLPILPAYCNLCDIVATNGATTVYYKVNHAVTVTARQGLDDAGGTFQQRAEKTLSLMIDIQPREWKPQTFTQDQLDMIEF